MTTEIEEDLLAGSSVLRVVDLQAKPLTLASIESVLANIQAATVHAAPSTTWILPQRQWEGLNLFAWYATWLEQFGRRVPRKFRVWGLPGIRKLYAEYGPKEASDA